MLMTHTYTHTHTPPNNPTQIFEAYGLGRSIVDTAFTGSVSRIGGLNLADLQREAESAWAKGFPAAAMTKLDDYGFIQSRPK